MTDKYLQNVDDGLMMRDSQDYAKDKLTILSGYISRFTTSMRNKKWRALNYIDLQAGPGKNQFKPSGDIGLGSPLIALTTPRLFNNYFLVELGNQEYPTLEQRIQTSNVRDRINLYHGDCNVEIDKIIHRLNHIDNEKIPDKWGSLNLAFIDPEGLEIEWKTIEKLGKQSRMDLIINFSTSGITRNIKKFFQSDEETAIDRFFGTYEWRDIYSNLIGRDNTIVRRELLDFYIYRLGQFGYENDLKRDEHVFKNKKNRQIYSLVFASKHRLGIKFWNGAVKEVQQPRLF